MSVPRRLISCRKTSKRIFPTRARWVPEYDIPMGETAAHLFSLNSAGTLADSPSRSARGS